MARRRRRRPDGSENLDDLEEDEDLDIRVTSVEEELQNLAVSTLTQTQQMTALRAKLDKVARELEDGNQGDDELFEEIDGLKTSAHSFQSQYAEAQAHVSDQISRILLRLDQGSDLGTLEETLSHLREKISDHQMSIEDRLRSFEQAREEEGDLLLARLDEFNQHLEEAVARVQASVQLNYQDLGDQIKELKQVAVTQDILGRLQTDFEGRLENLSKDLEGSLSEVDSSLQAALDSQNKGQQQIRDNFAAAIDELAGLLDERASNEDVASLKQMFSDLSAKLDATGGAEERSKAAVAEVHKLESLLRDQGVRINTLLEQGQKSLSEVEKHQDKVNLAVKLVDALSDRARSGSSAGTALASPVSAIRDEELEAPEKTELGFELKDLIGVMVTHQATDLHVKVDSPPTVRLSGELIPVGNHILGEEDCRRLIFSTLTRDQRRTLLEKKHLELICEIQGARMRALTFVQRGRLSASFKVLHRTLPNMEELGLPSSLKKLVSTVQNGLLLIGGPNGCGKSTTLAALVEHLNLTRKIHIVTLEQPLEHLHVDQQSLITQREVGTDSASFAEGIREAMRMDPDVIVIDRLGDPETLSLALGAAESGHLIIAGVDSLTVLQSLDFLCDSLSRAALPATRSQLAASLRGIVCQKLLPRADRKGLVVCTEVMLSTPAVTQSIVEGNRDKLSSILNSGEGMQSFAQSMQKLADAALISTDEARLYELSAAHPPRSAQVGAPPPPPSMRREESSPSPAPASGSGDDTIMGWL